MADARAVLPPKPQYTRVPVDNLLFDMDNPRLGGKGKRKTPQQVQRYLEGPPHYALDLIGSMIQNGFLPYEPLIVRRTNGDYVVIEGNRRLAAVKAILAGTDEEYPPSVKAQLRKIPVLVFASAGQDGDSEEILRYLGVKHLFGYRDWPPVSKAMFLDQRVGSKKDLEQVLNELNITRQEVARYLIPYRLTRAARKAFRAVNTEDFWSLAEAFSRKDVRAYIELDVDRRTMRVRAFNPTKVRHLARFLYGKNRRITDTRQSSALGKVLGSPAAAATLEGGATLDEALLYVESKQQTIGQLQRQLDRIFEKIQMLRPSKEDRLRILALVEQFAKRLRK